MNTETKQATVIEMIPCKSSQIAAIGHDPETNTLAIQFPSKTGTGSVYHYQNFTADDFALMERLAQERARCAVIAKRYEPDERADGVDYPSDAIRSLK